MRPLPSAVPDVVAVVLAGGRSARFGTDKLAAQAGGGTLLDVVLTGLSMDLPVVVVGPARPVRRRQVRFVREHPPGGGPAAALVAGVAAALADGAQRVVVLPGDAPGAGAGVDLLLAALADGAPAAVGVDPAGLEQPLQLALTRAAATSLVDAAGADGGAHRSVRRLLPALDARRVPLPGTSTWDVDTRAELDGWMTRDTDAVRTVLDVVRSAQLDVVRSAHLDVVRRLLDVRAATTSAAGPDVPAALVALDGHSGAGKSTLALAVASHCAALVVSGDDFYSPRLARLSAEDRARLTPAGLAEEVIDWRRLRAEALEPLLGGRTAAYRPFDWQAGDGRLGGAVVLRPAPVVLLDGVYSARPELADLVSAEVLVEAPGPVRRHRLRARDAAAAPPSAGAVPDGGEAEWAALWAGAERHYFATVRPPESFAVRVGTA